MTMLLKPTINRWRLFETRKTAVADTIIRTHNTPHHGLSSYIDSCTVLAGERHALFPPEAVEQPQKYHNSSKENDRDNRCTRVADRRYRPCWILLSVGIVANHFR